MAGQQNRLLVAATGPSTCLRVGAQIEPLRDGLRQVDLVESDARLAEQRAAREQALAVDDADLELARRHVARRQRVLDRLVEDRVDAVAHHVRLALAVAAAVRQQVQLHVRIGQVHQVGPGQLTATHHQSSQSSVASTGRRNRRRASPGLVDDDDEPLTLGAVAQRHLDLAGAARR